MRMTFKEATWLLAILFGVMFSAVLFIFALSWWILGPGE